eukprot:COSAG01_NODE_7873_length_3013_cov_24.036033_5_plen_82_part_00
MGRSVRWSLRPGTCAGPPSQHPPLAALATSAAPETPVAVVINAVMLAGQTAHQLMLLLGQQLATQRGVLGAEVNIRRILHA